MPLDLETRISDLLYHYDCVIIPELGGFVTEYRSAHIDKVLRIIHPPSKDLRFNGQLTSNDGLLANAIATAEGLTHEEANAQIKAEVEGYFTELEAGRPVTFEKVGILHLDSEKRIQFSPDRSVNYLLDSYRLKQVYAQPAEHALPAQIEEVEVIETPVVELKQGPVIDPVALKEKTPPVAPERIERVTATAHQEEATPVIAMPQERSTRRWMAAALIPLLFYIGFVTVRSDVIQDGDIAMSDLNPFAERSGKVYSARQAPVDIVIEELEVAKEATSPKHITPAEEIVTEELTATAEVLETEADAVTESATVADIAVSPSEAVNTYVAPRSVFALEFHVIGGCFSELSNAEKMVDRLRARGHDAYILDERKGLHRVTYGGYVGRAEATAALEGIKQDEQGDAWLLRKK